MSASLQPDKRVAPAPIVVSLWGGARFNVQIGRHELVLDQPPRSGGEDTGPSPLDLLGASLGGCIGLYVHRFLATRGIADNGLSVEVVQHTARHPSRVERFDVAILLPADVPPMYVPMVEAAARVCPAYNTLSRAAEVRIAVHVPAVR
jgi:uncharacterized OsmC-like protein